MGLDVYVGTMTRYFTRDWETVVERAGREAGIEVEIIREPSPPDAITDTDEIRNGVLRWKRELQAAMRDQTGVDIDWSESADEPYFTHKVGFDGHMALCLLAAYSLYPSEPRPTAMPDDWLRDRVYSAYCGREPRTLGTLFRRRLGPPEEGRLFEQITDLELWLPGNFTGTMTIAGLAGIPLDSGSTSELQRQLKALNARTYKADRQTMDAWLDEEPDGSFDSKARRALAIHTDLANKAVQHQLPMKLDY